MCRSLRAQAATVVVAVVVLSLGVLSPASAEGLSTVGPSNVATLAPLQVEAAASVPASAEVTAHQAAQLLSATRTTTAAQGVSASAGISKPWTMALNTVGVLGAVYFVLPDSWLEGDGPREDGATGTVTGSDECGWVSGGWQVSCSANYGGQSLLSPKEGTGEGVTQFRYAVVNSASGGCPVRQSNWNDDIVINWHSVATTHTICAGPWNGPSSAMGVVSLPGTGHDPQTGVSGGTQPAVKPSLGSLSHAVETTAECVNADGGSDEVKRVTEVATPGVDVPDVACGAGRWLRSGTHKLVTLDSTGAATKREDVGTYQAPDWVADSASRYPECAPVGALQCQLKLSRIAQTVNDPDLDCHAVAPGATHPCLAWSTDPNKTETYRCAFGPYPVALAKCGPYEEAFRANGVKRATTPAEAASPDPVAAAPTTGNDGLGDCKPDHWYSVLSPAWAFKATGCALKWAFVPPQTMFQSGYSGVASAWSATSIGTWVGAVGGVVSVFTHDPGGGDCAGPSFTIPLPNVDPDPVVRPLNACTDPMKKIAAVSKTLLTITVTIGGAYKCANTLLAAFGLYYKKPSGV